MPEMNQISFWSCSHRRKDCFSTMPRDIKWRECLQRWSKEHVMSMAASSMHTQLASGPETKSKLPSIIKTSECVAADAVHGLMRMNATNDLSKEDNAHCGVWMIILHGLV